MAVARRHTTDVRPSDTGLSALGSNVGGMSARDALPTGLALGARHLPAVPVQRVFGILLTLSVLALVRRRKR
jgi:hypothetical protein